VGLSLGLSRETFGSKDNREQIETNYSRIMFVTFARLGHYLLKIKIMAWRSGTGNVLLAMNSDCSEKNLVTIDSSSRGVLMQSGTVTRIRL
jgi:hypothetical protein